MPKGIPCKKKRIICVICASPFEGGSRGKYCSKICFRVANHKQKLISGQRDYKDKPLKYREKHLRTYYGIGMNEYNSLLEKQNGICFICQKPASYFSKRLCVDHSHTTGEIRGLLCTWCNKALAFFKENPEHFERAGVYLRQGSGWFVPERFKKGMRKRRGKRNKKIT